MRLIQIIIFSMALLVSCAQSSDDVTLTPQKVDVVIGAASVASTRTALDPDDGLTVKWCVGDQVAVWADGTTALSGEMFQLNYYGTNYSTAEFSSSISQMTAGSYTYSAFYPYTSNFSGKAVTYNIPSTQGGEYDGTLDFRVADPVVGSELSDTIVGNPELAFRSITHALKISIPAGYGSGEISKIYVITSSKVDGDATIEVGTTGSAPNVSGSGSYAKFSIDNSVIESSDCSIMTLDLGENTITAGDGKSAWLFIHPTDDVEAISFTSVNTSGDIVGTHNIKLSGLDFEAGYITPVNLGANLGHAIPSTTLTLKEGTNNLGESVNSMTITAPSGVTFSNGESSVEVSSNGGVFSAECDVLTYYDGLLGSTLDIEYDSDSATVSGSVVLTSENLDTDGNYKCTVPYLLEEDFSNLSEFSDGYGDMGTGISGGTSALYSGYVELEDYGLSAGWTASRVSSENNVIRICGRSESYAFYNGRIDSPKLSGLKSNVGSITIVVEYEYSGGKEEYYYSLFGGSNSGNPRYRYGYGTVDGGITGDTDIANIVTADSWDYQGVAGSFSSFSTSCSSNSFEISGATPSTRIAWQASSDRSGKLNQNGNYWLYLDNIRVSIK